MVEGAFLRCLLSRIPPMACRADVVKVSIKSGMARERGSMIPRPPVCRCNCAISRSWWGRVGQLMSSEMNFVMIWFVAEVKGPFQLVHVGGGLFTS